MSAMQRFLRNPRIWVPPALSSELTPRAGAGDAIGTAYGVSAAILHAVRNRAHYADPISDDEARTLLKGAAGARLLHTPDLPDGLLADLLAEGDDWEAEGLPEQTASADADALDLLTRWIAVDSISAAPEGFHAMLRAEQLIESISARVFEKRAGEAMFGNVESTSFAMAQVIVLAAAAAAQSSGVGEQTAAHWLAARIYRRRHAAVRGFIQPFRYTAERLTAAHQIHLNSVSASETRSYCAAALHFGRADDNLLTAVRVYLGEAAAIRSGTAAPPWLRSPPGNSGGSPDEAG